MKIGIVGNNDGPLVLLRSLAEKQISAEWTGLQNQVPPKVQHKYLELVPELALEIEEPWILLKQEEKPVDVLVNCFCNFKFSEVLKKVPVLNVHLSYLPKYRGRHPMHWALINGETEHGVSIHKMTRKIDAGDIYWQEKVAVKHGSSVVELRQSLMGILEDNFGEFMEQWQQGKVTAKPNRDEESSWFPVRSPKDSHISEWKDGHRIIRKVMALRSEKLHQAYLLADGRPVHLDGAALYPATVSDWKKRLVSLEGDEIMVRCDDGKLLLLHRADPRKEPLTVHSTIS